MYVISTVPNSHSAESLVKNDSDAPNVRIIQFLITRRPLGNISDVTNISSNQLYSSDGSKKKYLRRTQCE